jgi:hypothetical protein
MPEILAAVLPIILGGTGIAGLAATGVGLAESMKGSSTPAAPTLAQTTPGAVQNKQNQEAAVSQQFPNLQAATGGSLSPDALVQLSQLLSGQAGTPGVSGTNVDLINKIASGNTSTTPPGSSGLTNTVFG